MIDNEKTAHDLAIVCVQIANAEKAGDLKNTPNSFCENLIDEYRSYFARISFILQEKA